MLIDADGCFAYLEEGVVAAFAARPLVAALHHPRRSFTHSVHSPTAFTHRWRALYPLEAGGRGYYPLEADQTQTGTSLVALVEGRLLLVHPWLLPAADRPMILQHPVSTQ